MMLEEQVVHCPVEDTPREGGSAASPKVSDRDVLIQEYQHFVESLVCRLIRVMALPQRMREDFIASGYLGLVEAAGRFDAARGSNFRSFAFLRIRGAVIDHIRASCELSGHAYQTLKALEGVQDLRERALEQQIEEGRKRRPRSADAIDLVGKSAAVFKILGTRDESVLYDREQAPDPEDELSKKEISEKIRNLVATLPEKERTIIEQYYFHDRKLNEVAKQYAGLSKSWVSRLHERALGMLRDKMVEEGLPKTM